MAVSARPTISVDAPVELALVLICEKCGKRAASAKHNPSHELASKLKRLAKRELARGAVRSVLTSCMDLCPEDRVAVCIVPTRGVRSAQFCEVAVTDIDDSSEALLKRLRHLAKDYDQVSTSNG